MNLKTRSSQLALTLPVLLAGCGSPDGTAGHAPPPLPENVGTAKSELIGGSPNPSVNASQGLVSGSYFEQETAAVVLDSPNGTTLGHAVAFNAIDSAHISNGQYCRGYSASAFSWTINNSPVLSGATFRGFRFQPPSATTAMLFGDPAVVVADSGSSWTLYVSSLAVSNGLWQSAGFGNNCISESAFSDTGGEGSIPMDQVCVSVASIPKNGGAATQLPGWCASNPNLNNAVNYDGTALYMQPYSGDVYLASWNDNNGVTEEIDVFKNGTLIEGPFGQQRMRGHAIFAQGFFEVVPTVIAPDENGTFWLAEQASTSDGSFSWNVGTVAAAGFQWVPNLTLAGGQVLRQDGYAATIGFSTAEHLAFIYWATPTSPTRLQGARCSLFGGVNCALLPNSITPAGSNAFLPALAYVNHFPGGDANTPWLSYWTDSTSPTGNVQLIMDKINISTGALSPFTVTGVNETPCANGTYWGDYDSMTVANNSGAFLTFPSLLRYLTDSTATACNSGNPQHVSVTLGNPNQ